jgi:hypothetical protein
VQHVLAAATTDRVTAGAAEDEIVSPRPSMVRGHPRRTFEVRPVLSATLVGARMATGDSTGVEPLRNAERWLDHEGDAALGPIVFDEDEFARLPGQVAMYRAGLALLEGDLTSTVHHATLSVGDVEVLGLTDHVGDLPTSLSQLYPTVPAEAWAPFSSATQSCSAALLVRELATRSAISLTKRGRRRAVGRQVT